MDKEEFAVHTGSFSPRSIGRGAVLFLLPVCAYFLGLLPVIFFYVFAIRQIPFSGIVYYVLLAVVLVFSFLLFIIFETFIPGLFIRIFRIRVEEGEYNLSLQDNGFYRHLLFFALYRPSLSLVGIIPLVPLRLVFLKLVGLQIGKGSMVGGTELIDEPFAVTIGDHTLIGGYVMIYTHLSFKKMINKKVRIGNNCFIGNRSVIFPGVVIQDGVIVQPGSVVQSNQVLEKGGVYQGNPAIKVT
jgi:acetyltransferase-like isoleucine patch superfamily enzyme